MRFVLYAGVIQYSMPKKKKTRFAPDGTPLDKKTRKADDRDKAKKAKAAEDKAAGIKPAEPEKVGKPAELVPS